jgi:hypothetical protein
MPTSSHCAAGVDGQKDEGWAAALMVVHKIALWMKDHADF